MNEEFGLETLSGPQPLLASSYCIALWMSDSQPPAWIGIPTLQKAYGRWVGWMVSSPATLNYTNASITAWLNRDHIFCPI